MVFRSERLVQALRTAVLQYRPRIVVETGTYLGQGSTRIIAEAFGEHPPKRFYTIEVSRRNWETARKNLADLSFIEVIWGLSVDRRQAELFIRGDSLLWEAQHFNIAVEKPEDPVSFYLAEISGGLNDNGGMSDCYFEPAWIPPDGVLDGLLSQCRNCIPLIALDSAGGVGWLEFQEVIRLQKEYPFVLFLDDVKHVKHYRSHIYIQSHAEFSLIDCDMDHYGGWLVAVSHARNIKH